MPLLPVVCAEVWLESQNYLNHLKPRKNLEDFGKLQGEPLLVIIIIVITHLNGHINGVSI